MALASVLLLGDALQKVAAGQDGLRACDFQGAVAVKTSLFEFINDGGDADSTNRTIRSTIFVVKNARRLKYSPMYFLAEEGLLPEVEALAMKKAIALQLRRILEEQQVSKSQLAARMKTSRAALDRILKTPSLTITTIAKVAAALGHRVDFRLVPA